MYLPLVPHFTSDSQKSSTKERTGENLQVAYCAGQDLILCHNKQVPFFNTGVSFYDIAKPCLFVVKDGHNRKSRTRSES